MVTRSQSPTRRINVFAIAFALYVAYIVIRRVGIIWTDYLWFDSVALTDSWWTLNGARYGLGLGVFVITFAALFVNLWAAERISPRVGFMLVEGQEEIVERFNMWVESKIYRVYMAAAGIFGLLAGLEASARSLSALQFFNATSFDLVDPVFNTDVSFYVFRLPFLRQINSWMVQYLVIAMILAVIVHYLNGGIRLSQDRPPEVSKGVRGHISVLLALLAFAKAWGYRLDSYELLFSPSAPNVGAFYSDVNAQIPANQLLSIVALVGGVIFLANIRRRGWTLPAVAAGSWLAVSIIVGVAYPAIVQRFQVDPNTIQQETPYAEDNLNFTRIGYDLDDIEVREFPVNEELTAADLLDNIDTIENLRLWDPKVLEPTFKSSQELRPYYQFDDVDVDRYEIDGKVVQVELGVRELEPGSESISGWVNEHLVYTHGYGIVVTPANDVTDQGKPAYLVKDLPPLSLVDELDVTQPRIYYGASIPSGSFVIANSDENEIDPDATFSSYDGVGGVEMSSFMRRIAFAFRFVDFNTLISGQIDSESRVLMRRSVLDRVSIAAPFLRTDSDPYIVVDDGALVWVVDMYSVSSTFPYSETALTGRLPFVNSASPGLPLSDGFNYVRNSVKAVVDAYDGTMTFYIVDPDDPVVTSWSQVFPELFSPESAMPDSIRQHLRYPEDLFRVQSDMYRRYHVTDARVFLEDSDPWAIAADPSTSELELTRTLARIDPATRNSLERTMLPYYLLMELPGDEDLSFLIMQPFTPADKENMISFMIAKSGPDEYGKFIDFRLPANEQFDGPGLVGKDINQDSNYSELRTLLGQEGSTIIQGQMLVVPVENSILFVQPIYLQGDGENTIPEFKRVAVAFGEDIFVGETLDEALAELFLGYIRSGEPVDTPDGELPEGVQAIVEAADLALAEAQAALASGDLGTYQVKVDEARRLVAEALEQLAADS